MGKPLRRVSIIFLFPELFTQNRTFLGTNYVGNIGTFLLHNLPPHIAPNSALLMIFSRFFFIISPPHRPHTAMIFLTLAVMIISNQSFSDNWFSSLAEPQHFSINPLNLHTQFTQQSLRPTSIYNLFTLFHYLIPCMQAFFRHKLFTDFLQFTLPRTPFWTLMLLGSGLERDGYTIFYFCFGIWLCIQTSLHNMYSANFTSLLMKSNLK